MSLVARRPASEPASTESLGGLLADLMVAAGCQHFFLLTGGDNAFFKELLERGVSMALARSERSAAFMADAYARVLGRPSFVYGQYGPGAAVVLSGLIDAYLASTPVIAVASETNTRTVHRRSYQELDQQSMYHAVVKWAARVETAERAPDLFRAALRESVVGCPGPTYLGVPSDLLLERVAIADDDRSHDLPLSIPPHRPSASTDEIQSIVDALRLADKPVVLAGGGSVLSRAYTELRDFADLLQIPVATTAAGKGVITETHALSLGVTGRYSRASANSIVKSSDCVLAIGTRLNDMTTDSGRLFGPHATVLHVDIDPTTIGRNHRVGAFAVGDAARVLAQVTEALTEDAARVAGRWRDWRAFCTAETDAWRLKRSAIESEYGREISPFNVVGALRQTLEPNDILVADTGYMAAWTAALYDVRAAGRTYLRTAGSLGWALPASLGAQLAIGTGARVVCVTGDGGLGYHLADIETAVRLRLPVIFVVMNNRSLAFEHQVQIKTLGRSLPEVNDFADVEYADAAQALGASARRIDDPSDLVPAVREALHDGGPVLLDIRTDRDARAPVTHFESIEERPL
jgi:acetolactate synthase-1/2/3 large subunit